MHFYFDESGDFGFPTDRFDCYTQAALACPDSRSDALQSYVEDRCREWDVEELHATDLADDQIEALCRHIASEPFVLTVTAFDTATTSAKGIASWRAGQADKIAEGRDWYSKQGEGSQAVIDHMISLEKRARFASRCSDGQFVQGMFWIDVIYRALQQSVIVYRDDSWRDDFGDFRFVLDAKLPGKMDASEKWLRDTIGPIVHSNPRHYSLALLDTWAEPPVHPFVEKYDTGVGVSVGKLLEGGFQCVDSRSEPGLQLVDTVAYVVRRAVLEPDNDAIQRAYHLLVPQLGSDGSPVHVLCLNERSEDALEPYAHLEATRTSDVVKPWGS
ncbi:MAG: hypothetical protein JWL76_622 [Thermoleophilia bacterium]|nr:hypothetical protein [Thermoleophilia bacterium]